MFELVYHSEATEKISEEDIQQILNSSKEYNAKNNVTGCLIYYENEFIQLLEGDKFIVKNLFAKIRLDKRHTKVCLIEEGQKKERLFENWIMAYHSLKKDEMKTIGGELFIENFLALSKLSHESTAAVNAFWKLVRTAFSS